MVSTTSPLMTMALLVFASLLMILSGRMKKRLVMKSPVCPVCHRERRRCTCHWL